MRFCREGQSSLPKEDDFVADDDTEEDQAQVQAESGYAWKIIE